MTVPASSWDEATDRMRARIDATAADPDKGFPHIGHADGTWTRSPHGDWTGGFWVGELWLESCFAGRDTATAELWMRRLAPRLTSDTVFRSFLFYYGAVLGDLLCGSGPAAEVALGAAVRFAKSAHSGAGIFGLGTEAEEVADVGSAETSIDAVGAVTGLLSWAAGRGGDARLAELAARHTRWHLEHLVRDDGSVIQSASFDPDTAAVMRTYTHKGLRADSTWARAQAWGLLAATQGARWLPDQRDELIDYAVAIADWWAANVPPDGIPHWDFDVPDDGDEPQDTSAAAIVAACLLKLAALKPDSAWYWDLAERTLTTLVTRHLTATGMLVDGCYNRQIGLATRNELIWGDYFLLEALHVLLHLLDPLKV